MLSQLLPCSTVAVNCFKQMIVDYFARVKFHWWLQLWDWFCWTQADSAETWFGKLWFDSFCLTTYQWSCVWSWENYSLCIRVKLRLLPADKAFDRCCLCLILLSFSVYAKYHFPSCTTVSLYVCVSHHIFRNPIIKRSSEQRRPSALLTTPKCQQRAADTGINGKSSDLTRPLDLSSHRLTPLKSKVR